MVYREKLLSLDILIIFETLDFTRIFGTFSQNIYLSFNGIERETIKCLILAIRKTLDFTII